jgi:serine/threonine protein kinase
MPSLAIADYFNRCPTTRTGQLIGIGGFSAVSAERAEQTNELVAVKRVFRARWDQAAFIREVDILVSLNHPCILRIYGWTHQTQTDPAEIQTAIATNGPLDTILERAGRGQQFEFWNPTGKAILICGIALGMRFIHSKGIIHGDLKPGNILVNGRGQAVISDFGVSCFESEPQTLAPDAGTVNYSAPEQLTTGAICTRQIDVFAFALVMYEILTGTAVFPRAEFEFPIVKRILSGDRPAVPDTCGRLMQDLSPRCWSASPRKRPTFDAIIGAFRDAGFQIAPGVDQAALVAYVAEIESWEWNPDVRRPPSSTIDIN